MSAIRVHARNTLVRKYQLAYTQHNTSKISQLASVQECNALGECLRPTIFRWDEGVMGFGITPTNLNGQVLFDMQVADVDGDGRARATSTCRGSASSMWNRRQEWSSCLV